MGTVKGWKSASKKLSANIIINIEVRLRENDESLQPISIVVPRVATLADCHRSAVEEVLPQLSAVREERKSGVFDVVKNLVFTFMSDTGQLCLEPPPITPTELVLPLIREASPLKLVLTLSTAFIKLESSITTECVRRGILYSKQSDRWNVIIRCVIDSQLYVFCDVRIIKLNYTQLLRNSIPSMLPSRRYENST